MRENYGFDERVLLFIEQNFKSKSEFAEAIGMSRGSLSSIFARKSEFKVSFIYAILDAYPNLNVYWLLFGNSPKFWVSGRQCYLDNLKKAEERIRIQEELIASLEKQLKSYESK